MSMGITIAWDAMPYCLVGINRLTYLLTYLLTPWSRVLLEKLTSKLCS